MSRKNKIRAKIVIVSVLVGVVTVLHYLTHRSDLYRHILYQELYFVPLILAGFWFGLRGGLIASGVISILYLPVVVNFSGFSAMDFSKLLEIMVFNAVAAVLGFMSDRQKMHQKRLREAESLASLGKAVSMIAHDMKTPLIAIGGFARLVQKKLAEHDIYRDKLEVVIRETRRLENMVADLLAFAGPMALNMASDNVNNVMGEILPIVEEVAQNKKVKIETRLTDGLAPIVLDRMRLGQALINLIVNAIQASPQGETVIVGSSEEGGKLILTVQDHGCGIPPYIIREIFSPFFTTKPDGTGLGLAIVKKVIDAHGGQLEVVNNTDKGMSFRIILALPQGR
jgi:two-component system, NtrC family, sensor histidine kinase HydH